MTSRDTYDIEQYELEQLENEWFSLSLEEQEILQLNAAVVNMETYYNDFLNYIKNVQRYGV